MKRRSARQRVAEGLKHLGSHRIQRRHGLARTVTVDEHHVRPEEKHGVGPVADIALRVVDTLAVAEVVVGEFGADVVAELDDAPEVDRAILLTETRVVLVNVSREEVEAALAHDLGPVEG
jgi:hypothetical protein